MKRQHLFVAGKAIIESEGKILLLEEDSRDPDHTNAGMWDLPGGRIKFGEHPLDGLSREVREECGLEVKIAEPIYVDHWLPQPYDDEEWQIVGIFYKCQLVGGELHLSQEHKAFKWIGLNKLKDYQILPSSRKALEIYKNLA